MGQALYRKYRSKSLGEVVGQKHITATLKNALQQGKTSHAYLFTGPRGVGKTSIARILAHEINQLAYSDEQSHIDIIEIDAASNRKIDDARELREKVPVAPASAKYKIYIIDEVHMLTKEAFNVLLKTLEEPPAHVVFILATTEVHKLPDTIISRTQHFTFKPVALEQVANHLRQIASAEDIQIDDEALALVAAYGEGSFRDSIGLLDQLRAQQATIDASAVQAIIGTPAEQALAELAAALANHNASAIVQQLASFREQGLAATEIAKALGSSWRQRALANQTLAPSDFRLMQQLLGIPAAHNPWALLEIILLEYALADANSPSASTSASSQHPKPSGSGPPAKNHTAEKPSSADKPKPSASQSTPTSGASDQPAHKPDASKSNKSQPSNADDKQPKPSASVAQPESVKPETSDMTAEDLWQNVLSQLKGRHNTLYGIARMVTPTLAGETLTLECPYAFQQKRLGESRHQQVLAATIRDLTGQNLTIKCQLATKPSAKTPSESTQDLSAITAVFGDSELL
jgi:DNA polymerase-3 subunit gamma/tau